MKRPTVPDAPAASPVEGAAVGSRGRAREEAILAATVDLVDELGYERVTIDAIAARARASKATMYRRWPGKAELVADALRRRAQGSGPVTIPDTGSLRGDLLAAVQGSTAAIVGDGGPSLLGLIEAIRDDAVLRRHVREQIDDGNASATRAIVARAARRGELDDDEAGHAAVGTVLRLALGRLFLTALLHGGPPGADDQGALVDALLPLLDLHGAARAARAASDAAL